MRAGFFLIGFCFFLATNGCTPNPLSREENHGLISRCYAKLHVEKHASSGPEYVDFVVEKYYNYLEPYLVSDATRIIAHRNRLSPRSLLAKGETLVLPPPNTLLRPDFRPGRIARREVGLIMSAWNKFQVHECGLLDMIDHHEQRGGDTPGVLLLPERFAEISAAGDRELKDAIKGLEGKRIQGQAPERSLGRLREIRFAIGNEFRYADPGLELSRKFDEYMGRFGSALRDLEAWAKPE